MCVFVRSYKCRHRRAPGSAPCFSVHPPIMVCVLPLLVTPYANTVPLMPLRAGATRGFAIVVYTSRLVACVWRWRRGGARVLLPCVACCAPCLHGRPTVHTCGRVAWSIAHDVRRRVWGGGCLQHVRTCARVVRLWPHLLAKHGVVAVLGHKHAVLAKAANVVLLVQHPQLVLASLVLLVTARCAQPWGGGALPCTAACVCMCVQSVQPVLQQAPQAAVACRGRAARCS